MVGSNGTIYYSNDYGASFGQYTGLPATTARYYSIAFDENFDKGFIVGTNGTIIKTTNGASSWSTMTSPVTENLFEIAYAGSGVFYASGSNGTIIKYTPTAPTSTETLADTDVEFCLFPNPAASVVKLNMPVETTILYAFLTDASGKMLKTWNTPILSTEAEFIVDDLAPGTYLLTVNVSGSFYTKTFVKQ